MTNNKEKVMTSGYRYACLSIKLLLAALTIMVPCSARAMTIQG